MKDLEVMMINTISSAFETISTVEQGVELLDIFMHLQVREVSIVLYCIVLYCIAHISTSYSMKI